MSQGLTGGEIQEQRSKTRSLGRFWGPVVSGIAVSMSCFQLYYTLFTVPTPIFFRSIHLLFAMVLVFLMYAPRAKSDKSKVGFYDLILALLSVIVGAYIVVEYQNLVWRMGTPFVREIVLGLITVLLVLEMARRAVGLALALIGGLFILYTLFGQYSPIFPHAGFSLQRTVSQLYLTLEGIYGMPIGVMTSFVFLFILFSAFLQKTGAGDFLINLSFALMGRFIGGPAKAATLASGFFGSVSGSIMANVVGTGTFTIPMMRRLGYKPEFAGAVEVAASTGGQLMPPIMGAGVFIMAEWTGIPYLNIVIVSIVPAVLYYISVICFIHFRSMKFGIGRIDRREVPSLRKTLKQGWHYFIPVVVVLGVLIKGYTPMRAACAGIFATFILHLLDVLLRNRPQEDIKAALLRFGKDTLSALEAGAKNSIMVSAALACAGIIVGSVGLTGMGLRLSNMIISVTAGSLFLTIAFVAIASLIMGMELPVAASYIVVAILAVPALKSLGLSLLVAHLIVFWFSQDASVTPPVCLTAYAASAIAGGNPWRTGIQAWKLAKGLYIMPFLFAYTSLITGSWPDVIVIGFVTSMALLCIASFWEGYLLGGLRLPQRLLVLLGGILCLMPHNGTYVGGVSLLGVVVAWQVLESKSAANLPKDVKINEPA